MKYHWIIALAAIGILMTGCAGKGRTTTDAALETPTSQKAQSSSTSEDVEKYDMTPMPIVEVRVGDNFFTIDLEDNSSAVAFLEKISKEQLTVDMHDYGEFRESGRSSMGTSCE